MNMTLLLRAVTSIFLVSLVFSCVTGCSGGMTKKAKGEIQLHDLPQRDTRPVLSPQVVFVRDFDVAYEAAPSKEGVLHRPLIEGALSRFSRRDGPSREAANLVALMSESLVENFRAKGVEARKIAANASLPREGWLIRGTFTEIDEGSRVKRATIGFGSGATQLEVSVAVSDAARDPGSPFLVFGTRKDPGKMPGAVVTMNPYVAAAKFVMEKDASEKDVKSTAKRIVDEIIRYMQGKDAQ